ncbi:MAG: hypothetical protein KBC84_08105 [Proteobacteria bacterium]|nr:hypothetical protein [Pseudomonadota bacterium]
MTFLEVENAEFMPVPITFETFSEREEIFKGKERVNKNIYGMVTVLFSE